MPRWDCAASFSLWLQKEGKDLPVLFVLDCTRCRVRVIGICSQEPATFSVHRNESAQPAAVGLMLILFILWLSITNRLRESRAVMAGFGAGSRA